jgi:hypothetical protein
VGLHTHFASIRGDPTNTLFSLSAKQVIFTLIAALGLGSLFLAPLIAIQAAMPLKDMATSTAVFGLTRQIGATVGISIGQVILSSELRKRILRLNLGDSFNTSAGALNEEVRRISKIAVCRFS